MDRVLLEEICEAAREHLELVEELGGVDSPYGWQQRRLDESADRLDRLLAMAEQQG